MNPRRNASHSAFALIAVAAALSGCPGRIDNREPFLGAPQCSIGVGNVEAQIIRARCATSMCHDGTTRAGQLQLTSSNLASVLVGVTSATCSGRLLIDPADPELTPARNFFIEKLTQQPRCGERMPSGSPPLNASELACVRLWARSLTPGRDSGLPETGVDVPVPTDVPVPMDVQDVVRPDAVDVGPTDTPVDRPMPTDVPVDMPPPMDVPADVPPPMDVPPADMGSPDTGSGMDAAAE